MIFLTSSLSNNLVDPYLHLCHVGILLYYYFLFVVVSFAFFLTLAVYVYILVQPVLFLEGLHFNVFVFVL